MPACQRAEYEFLWGVFTSRGEERTSLSEPFTGPLPCPQQCCTSSGLFFIHPLGGRCLLIRLQLWPRSQCGTDEIHCHGHFWCLPLHMPWTGSPEPGSECLSQGFSAVLLSAYWGVPESRILLWWGVCMSFQQMNVLQHQSLGWLPKLGYADISLGPSGPLWVLWGQIKVSDLCDLARVLLSHTSSVACLCLCETEGSGDARYLGPHQTLLPVGSGHYWALQMNLWLPSLF